MPLIAPDAEHRRPAHLGEPRDGDGLLMLAGVVVMVATVVLVLVWSVSFPTNIEATADPAATVVDVTSTTATAPSAAAPVATSAPPSDAPAMWVTVSTAYCEHTAPTKSGTQARDGVVAVAPSNFARLRGSAWRIVDGPFAGKVVTVEDTGPSAEFDIWVADRHAADLYGRKPIHVQLVTTTG